MFTIMVYDSGEVIRLSEINPDKIKELRVKNKLTQRAFGECIGISDRAVSKWEAGISRPLGQNLIYLSKIFKVPVVYFFREDNDEIKFEKVTKGMESLTELYKMGRGPSSSHTIGPEKACMVFKNENVDADKFKAVLYGSLAKTGKGHRTDNVIKKTFFPIDCEIEFNYTDTDILHPNTMELLSLKDGAACDRVKVFSVGGESIVFENDNIEKPQKICSLDK